MNNHDVKKMTREKQNFEINKFFLREYQKLLLLNKDIL